MKNIVTDFRISPQSAAELERLGFEIIPTMPLGGVYRQICGHTDIQLHVAHEKAICAPSVYEYYKSRLPRVVRGSIEPGARYPYDIAYNACGFGDTVVCNVKNTAPEILSEYKQILNTRQGYTKCSICLIESKTEKQSAITSDSGLHRLLTENGIEALKISPGHISLYDMDGFIGGASGMLAPGLLAFNGDLKNHPDGAEIAAFCRNAGVDFVCLSNDMLCDVGGLFAFGAENS